MRTVFTWWTRNSRFLATETVDSSSADKKEKKKKRKRDEASNENVEASERALSGACIPVSDANFFV